MYSRAGYEPLPNFDVPSPAGVVNLYFRKPLGMDAAAAAPGSGGVALGTKLV